MEFCTLDQIDSTTIHAGFLDAFSDYFLPVNFPYEVFLAKCKQEHVDLSLSVGFMENNELVSFILVGKGYLNGYLTAYNAGTGTSPRFRRKGLSEQLQSSLLKALRQERFEQCVLEVIIGNDPAIRLYQKFGFTISRTLDAYQGIVDIGSPKTPFGYEISTSNARDWQEMSSFWDWEPTWQNSNEACELMFADFLLLEVKLENTLVGYLLFNIKKRYIVQLVVHREHRRKGLASAMLSHLPNHSSKPVSFVNTDRSDEATKAFCKSIQLVRFISQYEMMLKMEDH